MTDKTSAERRKRRRKKSKDRSATTILRRVGAVLTLIAVCIVVVVVGYGVGRYVIQGVITDTLGETPGMVATQPSGLPSDSDDSAPFKTVDSGGPAAVDPKHAVAPGQSTGPVVKANDVGAPVNAGAAARPVDPQPPVPSPPVGSESSLRGQQTNSAVNTSVQTQSDNPASRPEPEPEPEPTAERVLHRVQVGGFADRESAQDLLESLQKDYPDAFITFGTDFRVQVGSFSSEAGASEVVDQLRSNGHQKVHIVPFTM